MNIAIIYNKLRLSYIIVIFIIIALFSGCTNKATNDNNESQLGHTKFYILSASENKELEPVLRQYGDENGIDFQIDYMGSVDIMLLLQQNNISYDAVWPSNSIWISVGDKNHIVKYQKSISTSPIVFGVKKSLAQSLGFIGKRVYIEDISNAINAQKMKFLMSSASQSNSGALAYMGFLNAFLGNPEVITSEDLQMTELQGKIKSFLAGISRSSGTSEWLKDLFLKGNYDSMVNYESVIIATNKKLVNQGKEPLYLIYPYDGLAVSDSPLGFINKGDSSKEKIFIGLQNYLLSESIQKQILSKGRRIGFGGTITGSDKTVFNPDWGINTNKVLTTIKLPSKQVIQEALTLYQSQFKKPSYTVFALDFSGSMFENGGAKQLKAAMELLLDQDKAKKYLLQLTPRDKIVVIPFNHNIINTWEAKGNDSESQSTLLLNIKNLAPNGGTDIYSPLIKGLDMISKDADFESYSASVILLTDGNSNQGKTIADFEKYKNANNKDIPIFSIAFDDASEEQLSKISELTSGKVFDGRNDLINAFRKARGYN